jgi:two-component system, chemotaxis family, chemotaxis protein CheY
MRELGMSEGKVLVIDDDEHVRTIVKMVLIRGGYEVVEAENGAKGMQSLLKGDNPSTVAVIVCDMYLPEVNGTETIAYFRSHFPSLPVIIMTSHPEDGYAAQKPWRGVVDYVVKPIQSHILLSAVRRAVSLHVSKKHSTRM